MTYRYIAYYLNVTIRTNTTEEETSKIVGYCYSTKVTNKQIVTEGDFLLKDFLENCYNNHIYPPITSISSEVEWDNISKEEYKKLREEG